MLIPFKDLPETSRIWIYQSNRRFTDEEVSEIEQKLHNFLTQWTAHGAALEAACELRYHRFIIIGLNQNTNAASGCSIDASVHFIQQLEKEYDISLLDKMNVAFRQNDDIVYQDLKSFKKSAKQRAISKNTIVFNNLVVNKGEYQTAWEVPASESWHGRLFN